MYTRQHLLDSVRHETRVIQHLAKQLDPSEMSYRPSEPQRSTEELLQYMSWMAIVPILAGIRGNWEHHEQFANDARSVTLDNFSERMDAQLAAIESELASLSDADLMERDAVMPWGAPCKLGQAIVDMALKAFTAYRMQLFLYTKVGHPELGPQDCWIGSRS